MKTLPTALLLLLVSFASPIPAQADETSLDKLEISLISSGWGKPQVDKSVTGQAITIGGKTFAHGVGLHAPSINPFFPRLRSGHPLFQRPSPQKQIPSIKW